MATKKPAATHPSYHEMIGEAITALKDRTGSSQFAIAKYIEEKHKNLPGNFKKMLSVQMKKLIAGGKLTKVKNSYKLAKPISDKKPKAPTDKKKKVTKAKTGLAKKKAAPAEKKADLAKEKAAPAKKKAAPAKAKMTPKKRKLSATVAKPKVKKVGKSPAKKAAVAKKAKK